MSTIKIQTNKAHRFGETFITSQGEITWDEKGFAQVTKEVAEKLCEEDDSISIIESKPSSIPSKPKDNKVETPLPTPPKSKDKVEDSENDEKESEDMKKVKAVLNAKLMPELHELAKQFPEEEWKKLNKPDLVNYLAGK